MYAKDEYAVHEIDGEENKVCQKSRMSKRCCPSTRGMSYVADDCFESAICSKSVSLRKALPGDEVRLLRRDDLHVLPAHSHRQRDEPAADCRLLQQGEARLGQQQPSLHSRLSALAEAWTGTDSHGCELRAQ